MLIKEDVKICCYVFVRWVLSSCQSVSLRTKQTDITTT